MIFIVPKFGHPICFNLKRGLDISKQILLLFGCSHMVSGLALGILPGSCTKRAAIIGNGIRYLNILSITEFNSKISVIPFAFSCCLYIVHFSARKRICSHVGNVAC